MDKPDCNFARTNLLDYVGCRLKDTEGVFRCDGEGCILIQINAKLSQVYEQQAAIQQQQRAAIQQQLGISEQTSGKEEKAAG